MTWRLYRGETPISKPHTTRLAAVVEAFERKVVVTWRYGRFVALADGYSIRRGEI